MSQKRSHPKTSLFLATIAAGLLFVSLPRWWARPILPFPYWIYGSIAAIGLIAVAAKLTPSKGLKSSAPIEDPDKTIHIHSKGRAKGEA